MLDSKCKTTRVLLCNIYLHVRTCTCIILYIHDCVETLHVCTGNVYTFKFMDKQFESALLQFPLQYTCFFKFDRTEEEVWELFTVYFLF